MNKLKNKRLTRTVAAVFAGTMLFATVAQAATITKKIDASFRGIKLFYNNQVKAMEQEPFIYNGSVYLPVRAVSELVDKNVQWNSTSNSVYITDKGTSSSSTVQQLQSEIASKNFEIAKFNAEKGILEAKIKELEAKIKDGGVTTGDLTKTLKYLEDEFGDARYNDTSMDWDFKLTESSSRLNVEVSFDSRLDGTRWDRLSTSKRDAFFKAISAEIRLGHKDIVISGKVIDSRTAKTVGTFSYSKSNSFSYTDESSSSFSALEKDLLKYFYKVGTLTVDEVKIKGDADNITFTAVVDLRSISDRRAWENLAYDEMDRTSDTIYNFMADMEEEIKREYKYATIEGYIENYAKDYEVIASYEKGRLTKPR